MSAPPHITIPRLDIDSDADSDSPYSVGAPLTRMIKFEYLSPSDDGDDIEEPTEYFVRDDEINYIEEDTSLSALLLCGGDGEQGDPLLRTTNLAYVHSVVDHMVAHPLTPTPPHVSLTATPDHPSYPLLIRRLPSTSTAARELALWRYLNSRTVRRDPWNPSPPALSIIERELATSAADRLARIVEFDTEPDETEDEAYIVMDRLWSPQDNPFKSVGDWVDFSRQMLQGLVFLHEHNIAQVSYGSDKDTATETIMMDIGLAPPHTHFSRSDFPVKYYLLDFTKAVRLRIITPPISSRVYRSSSIRGRPKNMIMLSASRSRVPYLSRSSFISSFPVDASRFDRIRSDSNYSLTAVSSMPSTPPDTSLDMGIPKPHQFFTRPSSPDAISDPESESEEDTSEGEENSVRTVDAVTRTLLFATDLKNLADMLRDAVAAASVVSETLAPVLAAMRQGTVTAEDALTMFENAVRPLSMVM